MLFRTLLLLAVARVALALDFAVARGPALVNNETSGIITMNGIWYSQSNSTTDINAMDSLKEGNACRRDAALMAQLGINTIYVMAIDPSENHDDCFSIFNSVGIYVMVALRTNGIFQYSYNDFVNSYTADKMKGTFEVIDAVKDYENLLGFDMGLMPNMYEFGIDGNTMSYSDGEKLYRAIIKDTKEYISRHASRPILVGVTLRLFRNDELIGASDLTQSHVHWFSCAVDGREDDLSRADFASFYGIGLWETFPVEKQNETYASLEQELRSANVPTWFQMYGLSDEADTIEYELRPDLLNDTLFLYNTSSQLIQPRGALTGGARFTWTNTNLGWKEPVSNWGLVNTDSEGNVLLTENYDTLRRIFSQLNTANWLSGTSVDRQAPPAQCNSSVMTNVTVDFDGESSRTTLTIATDWALPTRPSEIDALVTSGAQGKRGQMVDVTITTIAYAIRDSRGEAITTVSLKPSKSQTRTVTGPPTGSGTSPPAPTGGAAPLSTGAKAGIGVGAGIGGLALAAAAGFFLLRRRRNRRAAGTSDETETGNLTSSADGFGAHKAELATGPEVEKQQAELATDEEVQKRRAEELAAGGKYPQELYTSIAPEPVELPVTERTVELPVGQGGDTRSGIERRD